MTRPGTLLSLVLSSSNQLNALKFTLLSLQDQAPDFNYETIVVDNASSDGTAHFLAAQAEKGTLKVVFNQENQGRTAGRNQGAAISQGRYLMFLDPGMVVGPAWWLTLVGTLERDPQVGAVAGKILLPDGKIDHAGHALLKWSHPEGSLLTGRSLQAGQPADAPASRRKMVVPALAGEALLVRASAFFTVGGFSEEMGNSHDQIRPPAEADPAGLDLCLKLGQKGWSLVYRPESIMTRLRVVPQGGKAATSTKLQELVRLGRQDSKRLSGLWLEQTQGDFLVEIGGQITPTESGRIRPYVEPVLTFDSKPGEGRGSRTEVSIVVLTHNALDFTKQCADSLLATTDHRHQLIFVDNGSSDKTPGYLTRLARGHRNVEVILNEANLGFAAGNNQGLAAAEGDFIILLNSDVVLTMGWVDRLVRAARAHPEAGLLGPVTNNISGLQKLSTVDYDSNTLVGLEDFAAQQAAGHTGQVQPALRLVGFCLLIKRELLARIGGLDEIFGRGNFEDNDYCLRSRLAGYRNLVVRDCFVHHYGSRSFVAAGVDYQQQLQAKWEIFKRKWGLPTATAYNTPVDLDGILRRGFDPKLHFHPLPGALTEVEQEVTAITARG